MATADNNTSASKALSTKASGTKKVKAESFDISRSDETLDLAKDLAKFILENKLTTNVQGKEFVNVEGWQYAGSRLGIVPIIEHVINVSNEHELKYQAKVTLFDLRHNATVGAGFAVCSNKEAGKKFYQEFAIMSMSQTRAIGKAYRNCLAWIIRAAGYEPTPAEEMDYNTSATVLAAPVVPTEVGYTADEAVKAVLAVNTSADLRTLWPNLKEHKGHELFDLACNATKVRWDAPEHNSPSAENAVASKAQRDLAHKLLASSKNDGYRADALQLLVDAGLPWVTASTIVDTAQRNIQAPEMRVVGTDEAHEPSKPVQYATAAQKEQIIRMLNHPVITRPEKTKMLLNINRLDEERANQAIAKLQRAIDDRENGGPKAA
ncbi:hypothetical protein Q5H92_08820 [Hymenobacter sp. M29]|uniref:ERF superfamily protein n=1 Tax=Hymenobacter mellowenesis TaxID=3063995 RepID=A0ABT9ACK7_9BACT|nr:hypothetical protein [Hymenobacter sp. M29]MDO7846457.1 hypothetical protein [Hymenobacter sp. M29]